MPATDPTPPPDPELVAAVRAEAGRAADRVGTYLRARAAAGGPVPPLSRDGLLGLSAALTLDAWDRAGLGLGRPAACGQGGDLAARVLELFLARTAWAARPHLQADVRIDAPDEDALVDALARHLWATRPRPEDLP